MKNNTMGHQWKKKCKHYCNKMIDIIKSSMGTKSNTKLCAKNVKNSENCTSWLAKHQKATQAIAGAAYSDISADH